MNRDNQATILATLEAAYNAYRTKSWEESMTALYALALEIIPDACYPAILRHIITHKVPDCQTADLLRCAAETLFPYPTPEEAFREVIGKAERLGLCGQQQPGRSVRLAGAPPFSHPDIREAVEDCGGWRAVCLCDNIQVLKAQFQASYARRLEARRQEQFTRLHEIERYPDLFPVWNREAIAPQALPAPKRQVAEGYCDIVPIPQVTRQLLAGIGQAIDGGEGDDAAE
jgi:hypothetical protein